MKLKIDRAGRIAIPKKIRNRFGLHAGSKLELKERPDGLMLRLAEQRPSMIKEDGFWVHLGKLPRGFKWNRIVDEGRDERIRELVEH